MTRERARVIKFSVIVTFVPVLAYMTSSVFDDGKTPFIARILLSGLVYLFIGAGLAVAALLLSAIWDECE